MKITYDKDGYDKNGFDRFGWNKEGINKDTGTKYNISGFDKEGRDRDGFDNWGWNREGINKETGTKYDMDGFDIRGENKDGYDRNGWDKDGIHMITGTKYNPDGFDEFGYDKDGLTENNKIEICLAGLFYHALDQYEDKKITRTLPTGEIRVYLHSESDNFKKRIHPGYISIGRFESLYGNDELLKKLCELDSDFSGLREWNLKCKGDARDFGYGININPIVLNYYYKGRIISLYLDESGGGFHLDWSVKTIKEYNRDERGNLNVDIIEMLNTPEGYRINKYGSHGTLGDGYSIKNGERIVKLPEGINDTRRCDFSELFQCIIDRISQIKDTIDNPDLY